MRTEESTLKKKQDEELMKLVSKSKLNNKK